MQNNSNMSPSIYPVHLLIYTAVEVVIVVTLVTNVIAAVYMTWTSLDWLFGKLARRIAAKTREDNNVRDKFRRITKYNRI